MTRRRLLSLWLATGLLASLAACDWRSSTPGSASSSPSPPGPTQPGGAPIATADPSTPGPPLEVEGVLEVEGGLPSPRFFLRTEDGSRVEVMAWLPIEVMQPPIGQTAPPTMADWVGQKVKLRGEWVQSDTGLVFQVLSAERETP